MLKAIFNGKTGRITGENGIEQSWREVFRLREDLLTAVFFSRIRYLTCEGELNILTLLIGKDKANKLGVVKEYFFWPRLTGVKNRSFVEPDVLISCDNAMILVEVKPPFGGQGQSSVQWREEINGLIQQRINDDSGWDVPDTIHFVALGKNAQNWQPDSNSLKEEFIDFDLHIHVHEWEQICHGVTNLRNIDKGRDSSVYDDWLEAFMLFGLVEQPLPFNDLLRVMPLNVINWQDLFPYKSSE